jgi:hypothetical protein
MAIQTRKTMKKLLTILLLFVSMSLFAQMTETTILTSYPRHDTTVTVTLTADYDWIAYFTFTNADANHDTIYIDISAKVNGGTTYTLISSDRIIFTDAVAATRSYYYTSYTEEWIYCGIWNNLRFRIRSNAASDEIIKFYFRKHAE